jgi:hypothetical protein
MKLLRALDMAVLLIALPLFIAANFPLLGWGVAAAAWTVQRALQLYANRRVRAANDPRVTVGVLAGSMIGRGWLVALSILAVGLGDNSAGLAAAVLTISLFTVYFTVGMILRPFETMPAPAGGSTPLQPPGGAR